MKLTQEEFFYQENKRNEVNSKAYRQHMKDTEAIAKKQVVAQEKLLQAIAKLMKKAQS